jgi:hypothetical protein
VTSFRQHTRDPSGAAGGVYRGAARQRVKNRVDDWQIELQQLVAGFVVGLCPLPVDVASLVASPVTWIPG